MQRILDHRRCYDLENLPMPTTTTRAGVRSRTLSLLLLAIALTAYLANGHVVGAGDTLPAAYVPWALLRHGTFDLGEFRDLYEGDAYRSFPLMDGIPYYLLHRSGRYLSAYGPGDRKSVV